MYWLGHACFYLESPESVRVVTDPYGPDVHPAAPVVNADIVTISHNHYDHNYLKGVEGANRIWIGVSPGGDNWEKVDERYKDVRAYTVPTYHDEVGGAKRGKNAIFVLEMGDLRLVHLGDLGHVLNDEQVNQIGHVDILMVPVGGTFTVDAGQAWQIVEALKPRVTVPMHYLIEGIKDLPIAGVDEFIAGRGNTRYFGTDKVDLSPENLPSKAEVWVLDAKLS